MTLQPHIAAPEHVPAQISFAQPWPNMYTETPCDLRRCLALPPWLPLSLVILYLLVITLTGMLGHVVLWVLLGQTPWMLGFASGHLQIALASPPASPGATPPRKETPPSDQRSTSPPPSDEPRGSSPPSNEPRSRRSRC